MRMALVARVDLGDDVNPAVCHSARREKLVGDALELVASAAHHDDLHAAPGIEVDVERRAHAVAEIVLKLGEFLGELANVVIVNDRERCYGGRAACHLRSNDLGADEVPEKLGARDPAVGHDDVEVVEQPLFHRDAETYELIPHAPQGSATGS
jgi:hypothetical protein